METIKINNKILTFEKILYVDVDGNNETGDGSYNNPYQSLDKALLEAQDNYCIFIRRGTYRLKPITIASGYHDGGIYDYGKALTIIGENEKTVLEFYGSDGKERDNCLMRLTNPNSLLAKLKINYYPPNKSANYNKAISVGSNGVIKNVIFENISKIPWSYSYYNAAPANSPKFENCIFISHGYSTSDFTGNPLYTNCLFDATPSRGTRQYCITRTITEEDLQKPTKDSDLYCSGNPNTFNPDGTQAHIGVYGGEFGWGAWLPQPIDSISYNTNQKSVGDTILISWGESDSATRYELQYYINNEWVAINNNITNTEYVYTFEQPNPTPRFRVRGLNEFGESDWVEGEVFEVTYQSSIKSNIVVNPLNKMRGYIDIIGYGESDLDSNITIRQFHKKDLDSFLEIPKKYEIDSLASNITVAIRDSSFLDGKIALNPSGRMRGFVDIVQPPKKTLRIYPVKDSVVRQSAPTINYGDSQQMLAGESGEGRFISYLGFDIKLPDNIEIESIKLVLNKQYETSSRFLMGLYETSDDWNEYDITWSFRPLDEKYITQFPIPTEEGRVEVDITDFNWLEGKKSFILRPRNYALSELTAFGTRESMNPPYIEVTYYEIIDNVGSYTFDSSITVRRLVNRDISARIDVQSDYVYTELEGLLEIDKKFVREEIEGSILVAELRHSEVGGQIELKKKHRETEIDTTIIVPYRTFIDSTIGLERKDREDDLESSLVIRAYEKENLKGTLEIEGKIEDNDLDSVIVIKRDSGEDLEGTLEIENKYRDLDLDSSITVGVWRDEYLDTDLTIERKDRGFNIESNLVVRRVEDTNLESIIEIPRYDVDIELDSSIYVLFREDLESSIEVPKIDSQDEIDASIELEKYLRQTDLDASMVVRVFWVSELESFISIERKFEIDGQLIIERKDRDANLEASIFVDVGGDYVFIM